MTQTATLTKVAETIIIRTPYNASLVEEVKRLPGRRWNGDIKAWAVPASQEQAAREIVRKFYQIEGEESTIEYVTVKVIVRAKSSSKRTYVGNVTIDGHDIVNHLYGNVRRNDETFEVLEEKGGFTRGDSNHAFEVEYELTLKVRKGAYFQTTGHADYWGDFEFAKEGK